MNTILAYHESFEWAVQLLEMTMSDVTPEQLAWQPTGTANSIAATYAHALCSLDGIINGMLRGQPPLFAAAWAGKTGISQPQFQVNPEWARSVQVDLTSARLYAQAVYADAAAYIQSLSDEDLQRQMDLSAAGLGERKVSWMLSALVIGHIHNMTGEISALKGIQGGRGYPF